jgi:hypothetical protein
METYTLLTDDAQITLESSRNWLLQGVYWLLTSVILLDGTFVGTDPPLRLVVRDRRSKEATLFARS